jgi:hypothetical protein
MEAAGIEPAPGGAKPSAESRPYLVTARNDSESLSRRVPSRPVLFQPVPHVPATYVQHDGAPKRVAGAPRGFRNGPSRPCGQEVAEIPHPHLHVRANGGQRRLFLCRHGGPVFEQAEHHRVEARGQTHRRSQLARDGRAALHCERLGRMGEKPRA